MNIKNEKLNKKIKGEIIPPNFSRLTEPSRASQPYVFHTHTKYNKCPCVAYTFLLIQFHCIKSNHIKQNHNTNKSNTIKLNPFKSIPSPVTVSEAPEARTRFLHTLYIYPHFHPNLSTTQTHNKTNSLFPPKFPTFTVQKLLQISNKIPKTT